MRALELAPVDGQPALPRPSGRDALYTVDDGSFAEGRRLDELALGDDTEVSMVIRDGNPAVPSDGTTLTAGDEVWS